MKIDTKKMKGSELIEELNRFIGKSINLCFGSVGGLTVNGVLKEKEQTIERIYNYKLNDATLNIYTEGDYELRIDDSYVCIGFSCLIFIKEV